MPADLPLLTLRLGSKGHNSTFSEHVPVAYQNKGNHKHSNMVANILPAYPPPPTPQPWGSKGQTSTFSEHGHVTYQIKGNPEYSNMVAIILPTDPSPQPRGRVKGRKSTFIEHGHVAYQIKWNHECSNMVVNILPADLPTLTLGLGSKGHNSIFSEHVPVAYQIKGKHGSKYFACIFPFPPPHNPGVKRSKFNFLRTWSCYISN